MSPGLDEAPSPPAASPAPTFWLTRFVILRWLGFVYLIAFLVAVNQIVPLLGAHGLTPAPLFTERVAAHFGSPWAAFCKLPSVFWAGVSDNSMLAVSWIGVALSLAVLLGYANAIIMFLLWALYMSIVNIGQDWYSYGWEIQLLETGFLAIFLCPLLDGRPFPRRPPPVAVFWLFRWLIFRIMLGAGLIKLRGDSCWRDLTCLYYHYQTQPLPNPFSRLCHFQPHWFQKFGVLWNFFVELVAPWFAFAPGIWRHAAGFFLFTFQLFLIFSGNLSFLNWLTIVPILACFDDSLLARVLPRFLAERARRAAAVAQPSRAHELAAIALAVVIGLLSIEPVANLISSQQIMNTSFNRLHLVNTYGAFGSVGRERMDLVFEGTAEAVLTESTQWSEYQFKGQPVDLNRRPPFVAPYQLRLDWQMWFAAMSTPDEYPWTLHFVWKLLHNDAPTLSLLANNPFPQNPPRYIRALLYRYEFAPPGNPEGAWWKRTPLGLWLPPLAADDPRLRSILSSYGWIGKEP
jgi:Lipase maturation factor